MAKLTKDRVAFNGKSGKEYSFEIYSLDTDFTEVGGVYVFTKRTKSAENYTYSKIYIGKTENFSTEFSDQEQADYIDEYGVNAVCALRVDCDKSRAEFETDLLLGNETACNGVGV